MGIDLTKLQNADVLIEGLLKRARIPGAALAVVAGKELVYAKGFGYRDLSGKIRATAKTLYPIASTTKTINATLIGMLVEEGKLEWDKPVSQYLPRFKLRDELASARVTLRDLVTMRTGLPRHDWAWIASKMTRGELLDRVAHLDLSTDFRQRFQYCNLSVVLAGHVAEVVTGESWNRLVQRRILRPLGMRQTRVSFRGASNATKSYHENSRRRLIVSRRLPTDVTAPSGGSIHSTVEDMARWLTFNMNGGVFEGRRLINRTALERLHAPQVIIGDHALAGLPTEAAYTLGWINNVYQGRRVISHGGYLHDVHSWIMMFPEQRIGLACFTNFGPPGLSELVCYHVFCLLSGLAPIETVEQKLSQYEQRIKSIQLRDDSRKPTTGTRPSHSLTAYAGIYEHPGYGDIIIRRKNGGLWLQRYALGVPLRHWHYDAWIGAGESMWPINQPNPFDQASPILFSTTASGAIGSLSIAFEPELPPIVFHRRASA